MVQLYLKGNPFLKQIGMLIVCILFSVGISYFIAHKEIKAALICQHALQKCQAELREMKELFKD